MKSLKEQLYINESVSRVWLLNTGVLIPADDKYLKYDDEDYINNDKVVKSITPGENFTKFLGDAMNDFKGSPEVVWKGTFEEYIKLWK